jgi:acyl-CoA reductase-like NAD-dependent aldehyde dehydrogenase
MVSLTGSVETGRWIAANAAESLKRVHLELGSNAPVIVFDDANLELALETVVGTGFYNAGQDCTAATRVLTPGAATTRWSRASRTRRGSSWSVTSATSRELSAR